MSTKYIEILDAVAEDILFAAGVNDANDGIDPEAPESSISAYYRGRESCKVVNLGTEFAKVLCGTTK